jgi:NAD(P)-dependent dehydrogenase (short-subunit alcohol dehydrogenase family)
MRASDKRLSAPRNVAENDANDKGLAIVTGGSRGIGRATAIELARSGFDVAILDIADDRQSAETLDRVRGIRPRSRYVCCDISKVQDHHQILKTLSDDFERLTCLVNNAGVQMIPRRDILDVPVDEFDRVLNTNLRGTFFLTQAFANCIGSPRHHPCCIINVTSVNAAMISIEKSGYCISKAALSMASQLFAVKLAERGIRVYEVRPGYIRTEMTAPVHEKVSMLIDEGLVPIQRWGEPEDVAKTIAAIAGGCLQFTTGDIIHVGGGVQVPRL